MKSLIQKIYERDLLKMTYHYMENNCKHFAASIFNLANEKLKCSVGIRSEDLPHPFAGHVMKKSHRIVDSFTEAMLESLSVDVRPSAHRERTDDQLPYFTFEFTERD